MREHNCEPSQRPNKPIAALMLLCTCAFVGLRILTRKLYIVGSFSLRKYPSRTIVIDCLAAVASQYPCTQRSLTSAIAAAGVNGTVIVPADTTISVTSSMSLSVNGLTFHCAPGATLSTAVPKAAAFYIGEASDVTVEGCHFKYSSGAHVAFAVTNTTSHIRLVNNLFDGFPAGNGNIAVAATAQTEPSRPLIRMSTCATTSSSATAACRSTLRITIRL
jgi:hypothetical protein